MIPGDLLSAFPYRQFHTLPGLLDSWAALPNSYPNACREAVYTIFKMVCVMTRPRGELTVALCKGYKWAPLRHDFRFERSVTQTNNQANETLLI